MNKLIYLFLGLLIVACSTDDSGDNNLAIGDNNLAIGDSYQGGIIYYILQSGDINYVAGETHGLIAATQDHSSVLHWFNGTDTVTGATGTVIGTGLTNTNAIIAAQGPTETSYAAGLARAYNGGGYTDWFLPSKDELNQLYENSAAIGAFTNIFYWSSTEIDNLSSWLQNFYVGDQINANKYGAAYVRAVRAF